MNDAGQIRAALETANTVAVVGCSPDPSRPSHEIAEYLQRQGYRIIPVNPRCAEVLGERSYPSLADVPPDVGIDVVDVFRRSEHVAGVAGQAIARGVRFFFMQLGVEDPAAAARLEAAGIGVAMNRCILVEHRSLGILPKSRNARAHAGVSPMSRDRDLKQEK
ncbi:MAG TPA: CoA-binding protein [Thermoanaerobaculia bacterium]|nr:CoA-binding protein [Thermoanaerobaculia bacterium]